MGTNTNWLRDNPGDYRCGICTSSARAMESDRSWDTYWKGDVKVDLKQPGSGDKETKVSGGWCSGFGWAPNVDMAKCKERCKDDSGCLGVSVTNTNWLRDNPGDYRCGICTSSARALESDQSWDTYWKEAWTEEQQIRCQRFQ